MKCDKCSNNREGDNYTFFYGTQENTSVVESEGFGVRTTTNIHTTYAGSCSAFLCNDCITREKTVFRLCLICLCASVVGVLLSVAFKSPIVFVASLGSMLFFILWLHFLRHDNFSFKDRDIGDNIVMRLRRKVLKKQGFNLFETRRRRETLDRIRLKTERD